MALSSGAIDGAINGALPFEKTKHYQGGDMVSAIAKAVASVFTSKATITVNYGGGGVYPITGVSAGALESAINGNLTISISGKHAKGGLLSKAVAGGVAAAISASSVAVPAWTSGMFPPIGFSSGLIKSGISSSLVSSGIEINSPHARIMDMVEAIASGVAMAVTAGGKFPANGSSGGIFVMT